MSPNNLSTLVRQDGVPIVKQIHRDEGDIPEVNPKSLHDKNFHAQTKEVSVSDVSGERKLVHQGNKVFAVGKLRIWIGHFREWCRRTLRRQVQQVQQILRHQNTTDNVNLVSHRPLFALSK